MENEVGGNIRRKEAILTDLAVDEGIIKLYLKNRIGRHGMDPSGSG
jgi:hypothetical protein